MTSRSRILRLPALVLLMTVVATCLAMLAAGSASAILPPCNGGGRIVNLGDLSLSDCTISGQSTSGSGGGVENFGTLDLTNVVISGNSAGGGGGGIYNGPGATLTLTNVVVTGNTSLGFGGGIHNDAATLVMSNVTITGNTAGTGGGGIANLSSSAIGAGLAVANNTTTAGDGGGILNDSSFCLSAGTDFSACFSNPSGGNSLVSGNHASAGNGGGIANNRGTLVLSDSTVDGNHAEGGDGGGIWTLRGTTGPVNATISNNTATGNGGGIFNDSGSVCCTAGNIDLTNLTIAGNRAGGNGGGVYTIAGFTILGSATIADNTATGSGGGVFNDDISDAFTELKNTLLARNGANCVGTIVSDGHNLDTGTTCALAGPGDQTDVGDANVGLRALAANGGPTQGSSELSAPMMTQALERTSPAVDAGSATCPATDERGVTRPQDGNDDTIAACDIGAFELITCPSLNPLFGFGADTQQCAILGGFDGGNVIVSAPATKVHGDVCIGPCPPGTKVSVGLKATIEGDLLVDSSCQIDLHSDLKVTGTIDLSADLSQEGGDATAHCASFATLPADQTFGNITTNTMITATKAGLNVIQVNGSVNLVKTVLTLDAGAFAGNVAFLINVTGDLNCGSCVLSLAGGLQFSDVVFNVIGPGNTVNVFKEVTVWPATILACDRSCVQDHAKVFGSWICGLGVKVHSGALICPTGPVLNP